MSSIRIARGTTNFEREPLVRPFGFKGGYMREIWQVPVALEATTGERVVAVSTQNVLWSDPGVFASHDEPGANALMYAMTEHAVRLAAGRDFETPIDLLEQLLPQVWNYGKAIAGRDDLRLTFALNALVGLDAAAWKLYAKLHGCRTFDDMLPPRFRSVLAARHHDVACIPLMAYGIPLEDVSAYVRNGYFFLKVKIGCDPDHDGDREKMLQWDMRRIEDIHRAVVAEREKITDDTSITSLQLTYKLSNGKVLMREYTLPDTSTRLAQIEQVLNCDEARTTRNTPALAVTLEHLTYTNIGYETESGDYLYVELTAEQALDLYENAIVPDCADGTMGRAWLTDSGTRQSTAYAVTIGYQLSQYDPATGETTYADVDYTPLTDSTRTLAWLRAHGIEPLLEGDSIKYGGDADTQPAINTYETTDSSFGR